MRKHVKKLLSFTLMLAMLLACVPSITSEAASIDSYSKNQKVYWDPSAGYRSISIELTGVSKASSITNLNCDNSHFKARAKNGYIDVYANAPGTTTVSFKVGTKTLSTKVTVLKYVNPFSSFKIGTTNYLTKFNNATRYYSTRSFTKKSLSLKMKSGWKITDLSITNGSSYTSYYWDGKSSLTKTITCNKEDGGIEITVYNTTNHTYMYFDINIL